MRGDVRVLAVTSASSVDAVIVVPGACCARCTSTVIVVVRGTHVVRVPVFIVVVEEYRSWDGGCLCDFFVEFFGAAPADGVCDEGDYEGYCYESYNGENAGNGTCICKESGKGGRDQL